MDEIKQQVYKIIGEQLGADTSQLKDNPSFIDLGADSLDTLEIVMWIEHEFNLEISDDDLSIADMENMSVNMFVDHVCKLIREAAH